MAVLCRCNNAYEDLVFRIYLFENKYTKTREQGLLFDFDNSTYKIGRQVTKNICGSVLAEVKVPWTNSDLTKDRIHLILKSTFYPHYFVVFNH